MRSALTTLAVAAALMTGSFAARVSGSTGPIPLNCDRACLEGLIDQYLAAVVAHDPSKLPLSEDVKYTENNQVLEVGDGFWKTASGIGNYKHVFADPEFGQVAMMGTMREANTTILMSLRLRIELGRITEIETVYFKPGGGGPNNIEGMDKSGKPEDIWFTSIPPAQRLSRQQMIAIADGYFTGLQKNDGKGINGTGTYPFTNDCHRIENGSPTTNVPRPPNEKPGTINLFAMDCLTQFKMGLYYVVQNIHGRRYPLVDAERGVVWAHVSLRSGHGESRRAGGRHQAQLSWLQPAEQHPRDRSIPDRERQDPSRRNDRAVGDVSHELAVAGRAERQLALLPNRKFRVTRGRYPNGEKNPCGSRRPSGHRAAEVTRRGQLFRLGRRWRSARPARSRALRHSNRSRIRLHDAVGRSSSHASAGTCITCHNARLKTGGLAIDELDIVNLSRNAEAWEKVVRRLRVGAMPPRGARRPDAATSDALIAWLEGELDRAGTNHPGRPTLRRLNRAEYANAIRDLLGLDVDVTALLPPDGAAFGFDNVADAQGSSPALLQAYLAAARRISAVAVGDSRIGVGSDTYTARQDLSQDVHLDGLPLGTVGGIRARAHVSARRRVRVPGAALSHQPERDARARRSAGGRAHSRWRADPLWRLSEATRI